MSEAQAFECHYCGGPAYRREGEDQYRHAEPRYVPDLHTRVREIRPAAKPAPLTVVQLREALAMPEAEPAPVADSAPEEALTE